ncbi:Arc family DNA-binding protein [Escherichia coli]|nr:Arc family DNA-binding protein [Escherichia coli]
MYSKYDESQFHLRLTHELHAKIKQRAKMNNRSLNSEIIAAIEESLAKQSSASVYIDDAERMAEQQSEMVKKIVFDTLKTMYSNNKKET